MNTLHKTPSKLYKGKKTKNTNFLKPKSKEEFTLLLSKIRWILSQTGPVIPYLIITIIIDSILSLVGVYGALVSKSLIDAAIGQDISTVIFWLIVMASIKLGKIAISPFKAFMHTRASTKLKHGMQDRLYSHLAISHWMETSKLNSVSIITRITSDVSTINSTIINTIPGIISLIVTFIASFSTLAYFAPSVAVVALVIGPLLLLISRIYGRKLKVLYKAIQEENIKYKSFIQESIQNLLIVKTFCLEDRNTLKLKEIQKNKFNLSMYNTKLKVKSSISMKLCSYIAYFSIFSWGAINIAYGKASYGTFTAMLQLYSNVKGPVSSLAGTLPDLISCIAATERLMEIENMSTEDLTAEIYKKPFTSPTITFNDVSFQYKKGNPVLKNINLSINPGETIALIGPSGEGKTTLIRLILSLIQCDEGEITISDLKYPDSSTILNRNHRELMSYVPQGNTLFTGTIEENLRLGKEDATFNEIKKVTEIACAWEFINKLEGGFDTLIGEKGTGVSEGQAQRIAIARGLLRKKPILILDEVTSSLDIQTELKVLKGIQDLEYNPICIIITHRPSALEICDKIYKLEKGHLKEVTNYLSHDITSEITDEIAVT